MRLTSTDFRRQQKYKCIVDKTDGGESATITTIIITMFNYDCDRIYFFFSNGQVRVAIGKYDVVVLLPGTTILLNGRIRLIARLRHRVKRNKNTTRVNDRRGCAVLRSTENGHDCGGTETHANNHKSVWN